MDDFATDLSPEEDDHINRRLAAAGLPNAYPVTDKPGPGLPSPTRSLFDDMAEGGPAAVQARMQAHQQPIKPGTAPAQVAPAAPAPVAPSVPTSPASAAAGNIDPDASVDVGMPDLTGSVAPATAKMPTISGTSSIANASDDPASLLGGGSSDDAADDARGQYARDNTATNKYLRSQGARMEVTPTGLSQPARDAQGNPLYKARVIDPAFVGQDGDVYRVSRDEQNNEHHFRIADGTAGQDFHEDPQSGEQYVFSDGANGASKRTVIGQNGFIPVTNSLRSQLQDHDDAHTAAALAEARAEHGSAGADGYGAMPLASLRQQYGDAATKAQAAQQVLANAKEYMRQANLTGPMLGEYDAAQANLQQYGPLADQLGGEISTRQAAIAQARQQRDSVSSDMQATKHALATVARAQNGDSKLSVDLADVLKGDTIPVDRAAIYQRAGLIAPVQSDGGAAGYHVTSAGYSILPRDAQATVAANPGAYRLDDETTGTLLTRPASGLPATPQQPAADQQAVQPPGVPGGTTFTPSADQDMPTDAAPGQPASSSKKSYQIGKDGGVQFDTAQPVQSVLAAFHDGVLNGQQAEEALSNAKRVQSAHSDLGKFLEDHPMFASAAEGLSTGAAMGLGAKAAVFASTPLNAALLPEGGFPAVIAAGLEGVGGAMVGAWLKRKAEARLGEYTDAVAALQSGAKAHPYINTTGEIIGNAPGALKSLVNLVNVGKIAAEDLGATATTAQRFGAGATAVAKQAISGAVGGALAEGVGRPVVSYGADKVLDAAGIEHDPTEPPTLSSVAQASALGALLAGHGIEFHDYSPNQLGSILSRGSAHMGANVEMGETVPMEKMAQQFGNHPNVDSQTMADWSRPLTPAENEIFHKAHARLSQLAQDGKIDRNLPYAGTARQATRGGTPIDSTAVELRQGGGPQGPPSGETPSTGPSLLSGGRIPESPDSSDSHAPAPVAPPAPPSDVSPAARATPIISSGTSAGPSPTATGSAASGQAVAQDDKQPSDDLSALVQQRDDTQRALDAGSVAPAARQATQGLVDQLSAHIEARRQPAAPQPPTPSSRAETPPSDPAAPADVAPSGRVQTSPAAPLPGARGDDAGLQAIQTPPAADTSRSEIASSPSAKGSTPTAAHHQLAERVSGGHESQEDGELPNPTFTALRYLRQSGVDVTPEFAREFDKKVQAVKADSSLDLAGKTAALRHLTLDHVPAHEDVATGSPSAPSTPATTFDKVVGPKIDAKRTAFHADSGHLGISREQMPQVAAEHRGALANFLPARGIKVSAEDMVPGSLKPSQGEFNPAKVEKARRILREQKAAGESGRKILYSEDGHVIDGHHQWLAYLQDHPNEPMPGLKLHGTARDILGQIHEFPSAGMEKAPDLAPRIEAAAHPNDKPVVAKALSWVADQRQAGAKFENLLAGITKQFPLGHQTALTLVARQAAAEQVAKQQAAAEAKSPAPAPAARQPVTAEGKEAQRTLERLNALRDKGTTLDGAQRQERRKAEITVAHDLNRQVLGDDPQPTTDAGKRALANIQRMEPHLGKLSQAQLVQLYGDHAALEKDFTAQRLAIEQRQAGAGTSGAGVSQENSKSLASKGETGQEAQTPAVDQAAAPTFRKGQAVTYKGRDAVVEGIVDGKAVVRVKAGTDPKTGANLRAKRVRDVPLAALQNALALTPEKAVELVRQTLIGDGELRAVAEALGIGPEQIVSRDLGGAQSSGIAYQNGRLLVDPAGMADSLARLGRAKGEQWLRRTVAHEVTHHAQKLIPDADARHAALVDEALRPGSPTRALYDLAKSEYAGFQDLDKAEQGYEMGRIAIEKRWRGTFTEQLYSIVKDVLAKLRSILERIPENTVLKRTIADVEAVLRQAGARIAGEGAAGHEASPEEHAQALAEYHAGLRDEAADQLGGNGGTELLAAVRAGGGLPTGDAVLGGELERIRQNSQASHVGGYKGTFNLFRASAPKLDALLSSLREQGFDFDTPDQMLAAIEQRVTDKKPQYGFAAASEAQSGMAGSAKYLGAARPDARTLDLFGDDEDPFNLRAELGSPAERIAAARDAATRPQAATEPAAALPTLRDKEKGTGELFQGEDQPFNLAGEKGIDHGARQAEQDRTAAESADAQAKRDRQQQTLFAAKPEAADPERYRPATPEDRKRLGIPPAWTDVHVAADPDARRVAVGKDSKGRIQSRYSAAHTAAQQAVKFERLTQFNSALPSIMARIDESLTSGKGREEAAVLRLIHASGFRNGGDEDTGAMVKAYGASNLRAEHVAFEGDTTHFDFTGKLGVRQQHSITDPTLTADLRVRAAKGGALFNTNDAKVRDYLKGSGDFKVHDFRTWNATDLARREVAAAPTPKTAEAFWNERDRIGDLAAKKLGDTRKIVLESYVDPTVFEPWKSALKITDESRPKSSGRSGKGNAAPSVGGRADEPDAGVLRDEQLPARSAPGSDGGGAQGAASADRGTGRLAAAKPEGTSLDLPSDPTRADSIKSLVDETTGTNAPAGRRYARYATVSPEQAAQLKASTGLDLEGYKRNLDASAVRHVLKNHGDPAKEIARGNAPLSKEDFERLPQILEHPDASMHVGKNARGLDVIAHAKRVNGHFIVIEEVRDGKQVLNLTTLYKKSAPPLARGADGQPDPAQLQSTAQAILQQVSQNFKAGGVEEAESAPSAAPEKAAPTRVEVPRQPGDTDKVAAARAWVADERAAGRQPNTVDVVRKRRIPPTKAGDILAAQDAAEKLAGTGGNNILAAAKPEAAAEPSEWTGTSAQRNILRQKLRIALRAGDAARAEALVREGAFTPEEVSTLQDNEKPNGKPGFFERTRADIARKLAQAKVEDLLSAHHDAVDTMAAIAGRQAKSSVRELDIPDARDRQAAGLLVEAGYDPKVLASDLTRVQASPDKKLAARYAPLVQHAIDQRGRLTDAAEGFRAIDAGEAAAAESAGLAPKWQERAKHVYDDPSAPENTVVKDKGFGATKGFKRAVDALAAGVDPKSTDLADLAERRVARNRQAIHEHAFQEGLAGMKASDGKPMVSAIEESSSKLNADGSVSGAVKVPAGYKAVQTGANVLVAHKDIAQLLEAFYGQSAVRDNFVGKHLLDLAAVIKHGSIGIDTYHGFQTAIRSFLGQGVADYRPGKASLDFADRDLDRAVKAGKITKADADEARANRALDDGLVREGFNLGRATDNLLEATRQANLVERIPVLGHAAKAVADFTFHDLQPGFMRQAARIAYAKNKARFPELSEQELLRRTAKEQNEFYGNLGTQGWLKSKSMQDASKIIFFAPGFAEGRLKTEVRGVGQAARAVADGVRGRGWRLGVVAQALGGIILASLIGNQLVNFASRGKPTWENEEDGHRWDAWIPGGAHNKGFFFSPLAIAAEYSHALTKYLEHRESAVDALTHIVGNKLSGVARAAKTLATGQDYRGQPFASMGERLKAAAGELLPLPMQLSPWVSKDAKGALGLSFGHGEKGSVEKQLLATAGLRVDPADSARSQMYALAEHFRAPRLAAAAAAIAPSAYAALRKALGNEDQEGARAEILRLATEGHKTLDQIADKAAGIQGGKVHPEYFTGSRDRELQMIAGMTPAQRQIWKQAFADRVADARLFAHLVATMPPDQKRRLQIASALNRAKAKTPGQQPP